MKITVTADHIGAAKCGDPHKCMIAEAIRDSVRGVRYVSVRTNGISITQRKKDGVRLRSLWTVPLKAARAIVLFDKDKDAVRPFSFEPKLVEKWELSPRSAEQKAKDREYQRTKRTKMKANGKPDLWRLRMSGV